MGNARTGASASRSLKMAETLRKARNHAEAIAHYQEAAAAVEIPDAVLCLGMARCQMACGEPAQAVHWLLRVVEAGEDFRAWQEAASLLDRIGRCDDLSTLVSVRRQARVWLTGSYTLVQLAPLLRLAALHDGIVLEIGEGDYGQFQQDALDAASPLYRFAPDVVLLALHHTALGLPHFAPDAPTLAGTAAANVVAVWDAIRTHSGARVVSTNIAAPPEEVFGHLATRVPGARTRLIDAINQRLGDAAAARTGVSLLDCEALSGLIGKRTWFDDRYWHLSKQAVSFHALPLLARHLAAVIAADLGLSRKCLVLDLDNTLWGGVVGEDGLSGIRIGQGDAASEAFLAFQHYLKGLQEKGVILAVCSKNNDADAREPFVAHPDMLLKLSDFAMFVANWEHKPENLTTIARTLNIGMDSLVFVDDNPVERAVVRKFCPDVGVIPLPADPSGYVRALSDYLGFETTAFTPEDARRTEQYRAKAQISELESSASSIEEFHRSLRMRAVVAPFDELHMPRIVQLIGKTNQFNLTTPRYSASEVHSAMAEPGAVHLYLKLQDRFADHGLVSLVMARRDGESLDIHLWLMSCRVIGRTVEAELLSHLARAALRQGLRYLRGTYRPTRKNAMVRDLYAKLGFELVETQADGTTVWAYDLDVRPPPEPGFIEVITCETEQQKVATPA